MCKQHITYHKMIKFQNYSILINGDYLLNDISFSVKSNGVYIFSGPSGSGKSSILNAIAKSNYFDKAEITGSKIIDYRNNDIHYLTVDDNVFGFLTVNDNLKIFSSNQEAIDDVLNDLHIFDLKNTKCSLLSKGERERVAIAGGLIDSKKLLLIDEPTANIDNDFSNLVYDVIFKYSSRKIIIIATHDYKMIEERAKGVLYLKEGKIIKNTIDSSEDEVIKPIKNKLYFPFSTYLKFSISSLLASKAGFIINTIVMSLAFLLMFVSVSNYTIDYQKSYQNMVMNVSTNDYVASSDARFDPFEIGYKEYLNKERFDSSDVVPTFSTLINSPSGIRVNTIITYDTYYSNAEIKEKINNFSTRYSFEDNDYRYYPIYFSDNMMKKFKEHQIYLEIGDEYKFNRVTSDDYRFIFDGTYSDDSSFEAIIPENYRFERYDEHIALLDFNSNLDFYDERDRINQLGDIELIRYATWMGLGDTIKPYTDDVDIFEGGHPITNDDEVIISNSFFFYLLYSDDERLLPINYKYRDYITINNPSYSLKGILEQFKVVGLAKNNNSNSVYVSQNVYDQIRNRIIDNDYNYYYSLKYSKDFISNNIDEFIEGRFDFTEVVDLGSYDDFYETSHGRALFIFIISLCIALISLAANIIYCHNINKKNYKNYSLLMLVGKNKKEVYGVYSLMMCVLLFVPFIVGAMLGWLSTYLIEILLNFTDFFGSGSFGNMVYGVGYGYLGIIILYILFLLILLPTVILLRKKKAVYNLYHE